MITLSSISKNFGEKKAVCDLSFTVGAGQVLGLLGPNGAGKSTTMKMITGCLRPSSGRVTLGGFDIWDKPLQAKARLGFLPESAPSYDDLTVQEFLNYFASLRGMKRRERAEAVSGVIKLCDLEPVRNQSVDTLSKGYKHRICLAQSLVHNPEVIVFDEPTDGLDPNQKREVQSLINRIREEKAIILSTHILDEVENMCTDVVLLHQGRIIRKGTPAQLRSESTQSRHLCIHGQGVGLPEEILELPGIKQLLSSEENRYRFLTDATTLSDRDALARDVLQYAQRRKWQVTSLSFASGSLEEVFRTLTYSS